MKKLIILLVLSSSFFLVSCNDYGKKVKISDKTEIYIKKDATEDEAKKLGAYIESLSKDDNEKSFQLSKESGDYTVRMVINQEEVKKDPSLAQSFMALRFLFNDKVFTGSKVKMILTDDHFKDLETVKDTTFTE